MRYLIAAIITAAFFMQVSCKSDEEVKNNDTISGSIREEAVQEKIDHPVVEKQEIMVVEEAKEEVKEVVKEEVKEIEIAQSTAKSEPEKKETVPAKKVETPKNAVSSDDKGIVSYVEGTVRKKTLEEEDFKTNVAQKAAVKSRESYKTMVRSRAELELSDMDILRLAPRTTVDLVALYEETRDGKQKTDIKLEEGDLWAQVNSSGENSEFMMDTDIAAAAITGTNFRMSKDGELTEMKVYHGEVKISNAKDKMNDLKPVSVTEFKKPGQTLGPRQVSGPKQVSLEEWVYIVKNMQKISFDKNGKVVSAGEFKASDADEANDWVKWNKSRDRQRGLK